MENAKYLLVIAGPTASGKTAWSIRLAQLFQTVILSADSRQFYREMNLGTAKPTQEELAQATHYFIDSHSITAEYSVGDYEREALQLLDRLFQQHDVVILTGGSGLFVQAVCEGFDDFPEISKAIREALQERFARDGIEVLQEELQLLDPVYYAEVDLQNPQRLMRALEVCRATGKPYSQFRRQQKSPRFFHPIYLFAHWPRAQLYQRIDQRVDQMMAAGLLEEVTQLLPFQKCNALQTVGYQELFAYLEGKTSLEEAVDLIKRNSRRFAKRQLTWNRRLGLGKHFHPSNMPLLQSYLSWVWASGSQCYWERKPESPFSILGWKSPEVFQEVLKLEVKKKSVLIGLANAENARPDVPLQYYLLHEVLCKFPETDLIASLSDHWTPTLKQLGFIENPQSGSYHCKN